MRKNTQYTYGDLVISASMRQSHKYILLKRLISQTASHSQLCYLFENIPVEAITFLTTTMLTKLKENKAEGAQVHKQV